MTAPARDFHPFPDVPGVSVWQPPRDLHISLAPPTASAPFSPQEDRAWADLCAANPRLHDAPILAVAAVDPAAATITCRRDRYRRLAVHSATNLGDPVSLLGVKGWITARDRAASEHLLIARRGSQTRVYPNLWESAPAGGVACPLDAVTHLDPRDILATLALEAEEELGLSLPGVETRLIAVCRDEIAHSHDLFLALDLPDPIDPRHAPSCQHTRTSWEYSDTAWLARTDARTFDQHLVPPTRAVLRLLHWV